MIQQQCCQINKQHSLSIAASITSIDDCRKNGGKIKEIGNAPVFPLLFHTKRSKIRKSEKLDSECANVKLFRQKTRFSSAHREKACGQSGLSEAFKFSSISNKQAN
jgi:hypothetical protein